MRKLTSVIVLTIFSLTTALAGTIRGKVIDAVTGEAMAGITIHLSPIHKSAITGLDGSYTFKNIPQGTYTLTAGGISYQENTQSITLTPDQLLTQNISLSRSQTTLQQATVTGVGRTSGATDAGARQLEKISDNVVNILSTHQLQLMPDVTVANVLRRVSGVTVDRDRKSVV